MNNNHFIREVIIGGNGSRSRKKSRRRYEGNFKMPLLVLRSFMRGDNISKIMDKTSTKISVSRPCEKEKESDENSIVLKIYGRRRNDVEKAWNICAIRYNKIVDIINKICSNKFSKQQEVNDITLPRETSCHCSDC